MADENAVVTDSQEESPATEVKFCPICGAQMYQGMQFGMMFWICPEGDYDEPI